METKLKLQREWEKRSKLYAEGDTLWAEANKLYAERDNPRAEGYRLCAEGNKLYAEGDTLWITAVIAEYGNCKVTWVGEDCLLNNGDLYKR